MKQDQYARVWETMQGMFDRAATSGLREMDYTLGKMVVDNFLKEYGIEVATSTREYRKLCHDSMVGMQRAVKIVEQWKDGDFSTEVESVFASKDILYKKDMARVADEQQKGLSKSLSDMIALYAKEFQGSWTAKSKAEIIDGSLALFVEVVGDVPIQQINRKKVSEFKQALLKLPPNHKKSPKYGTKTIQEILEMA